MDVGYDTDQASKPPRQVARLLAAHLACEIRIEIPIGTLHDNRETNILFPLVEICHDKFHDMAVPSAVECSGFLQMGAFGLLVHRNGFPGVQHVTARGDDSSLLHPFHSISDEGIVTIRGEGKVFVLCVDLMLMADAAFGRHGVDDSALLVWFSSKWNIYGGREDQAAEHALN